MRVGSVLHQCNGLDRRSDRLDGLPIHRRSLTATDIRVMVEDLKRDRIFARDGQIKNLPGTGGALGDILTF